MPILIAVPKEAQISEFIADLPSIQDDERWFALDKGATSEEWQTIASALRPGDAIRVGPDVTKKFILEVAGFIPPFCGLRFNLGRSSEDCVQIVEKLVENAYIAVPSAVFCDPTFIEAVPVTVGIAIPLNALARELRPVLAKLSKGGHYVVVPGAMPREVLKACEKFKGSIRVLPSMDERPIKASSIKIVEKYLLHPTKPLAQRPKCSIFVLHKDTEIDSIEAIVGSLPQKSCLCLPLSLIGYSEIKPVVRAALNAGVIIRCNPQAPFQAENTAIAISDLRSKSALGKRNLQERGEVTEEPEPKRPCTPLRLFDRPANAAKPVATDTQVASIQNQ